MGGASKNTGKAEGGTNSKNLRPSKSCIKKEKIKATTVLSLRAKSRSDQPSASVEVPHFTSKEWRQLEAQKILLNYSSNGWLVGGKTSMKNWKTCASIGC